MKPKEKKNPTEVSQQLLRDYSIAIWNFHSLGFSATFNTPNALLIKIYLFILVPQETFHLVKLLPLQLLHLLCKLLFYPLSKLRVLAVSLHFSFLYIPISKLCLFPWICKQNIINLDSSLESHILCLMCVLRYLPRIQISILILTVKFHLSLRDSKSSHWSSYNSLFFFCH